jgi:biotin carboxyl carrier protein
MKLKITVHGVAYEVEVEVLEAEDEFAPAVPLPRVTPPLATTGPAATPSSGPLAPSGPVPGPASARTAAAAGTSASGAVTSPIAGTVIEVKCKAGDEVTSGQTLLVIEAMKMETAIAAPATGRLKSVRVAAGDSVRENEVLVELA